MSSDRYLLREMEAKPTHVAAEPPTQLPPQLEQVEIYSTQAFDDKSQILRVAKIPANQPIPCAAIAVSVWFDSTIPQREFLSPLELGFKVTTYDEVAITRRYQELTDDNGEVVKWTHQLMKPPPIHPDFYQSFRVWRFIIPIPKTVTFLHERMLMVELNAITNYLYQGKYDGLTFRVELVPDKWVRAVHMYCKLSIGFDTFLAQYFPVGIHDGNQRKISRGRVFRRSQWKKDADGGRGIGLLAADGDVADHDNDVIGIGAEGDGVKDGADHAAHDDTEEEGSDDTTEDAVVEDSSAPSSSENSQ